MRIYDASPDEPAITSPDHTANRLCRTLGGFVGRIVFASTGPDFANAVDTTAQAFPGHVGNLHVHGLLPAEGYTRFSPADRAAVAQMVAGLANGRPNSYATVVNTGVSDSRREQALVDPLVSEIMRIWAETPDDHEYGLVFVANSGALPEPFDQQPSPASRVLRLSGAGVRIAEAQLDLQWHQLRPQQAE